MMKYTIISKECEESTTIKNKLRELLTVKEDNSNPDYIFVIGGDGTILRAVHQFSSILDKVIIFGIHTGHLGFLTNYKNTDVDNIINKVNTNELLNVEEHNLLEYTFKSNEGIKNGICLNEVTITSAPYMIELNVVVDKTTLQTFKGGGLCISTPLGSTGYNKSLNGCVIDHSIPCIQITEIAGICSNSYKTLKNSLLLSNDREIKIEGNNKYALFTYDNNSLRVDNFNSLEVKLSNKKVKFSYINDINFVKRVNKSFL